ncbi:hypothetical protein [Thiomonas sp.]
MEVVAALMLEMERGKGIGTTVTRRPVTGERKLSSFTLELQALVKQTGLTHSDFLDELMARTGVSVSRARFSSWMRGAAEPQEPERENVLLAARALTTEAARYPKPPVDLPAEVVREAVKEWQRTLTLKQISVITGIPFITLRSWDQGRHKRVRYAKWQQANQLMQLWLDTGEIHGTDAPTRETFRQAVEIVRKHPRRIQPETVTASPVERKVGVLSLSKPNTTDAG